MHVGQRYSDVMATPLAPVSDPKAGKPPHTRRWIPLSLKLFAILLTLLACVCGWHCWRGYQQLVALRQIEEAGGEFEFTPFGPPWLRSLVSDDIARMFDKVESAWRISSPDGDQTLVTIASGLPALKSLQLNGTTITERGLLQLKRLDQLHDLDLSGTQIEAKGLRHLAHLSTLEILDLTDTDVDDAGLKYLALIKSLKTCHLAHTRITDSGLKSVAQMTSLEALYLDGTDISDNGLFELRTLKNLHWLFLKDTSVTSLAANRLDQELPLHPLRNYVPRVMYSKENDPFSVLSDQDPRSQ